MTKPLRSMTKEKQLEAIKRRIAAKTLGLGYWAARDAAKKLGLFVSEGTEKEAVKKLYVK